MNLHDYMSGETHWGFSKDPDTGFALFTNEFSLIPNELLKRTSDDPFNPQPYTEPAPIIICSYEIYQRTGGTAIVLLFFDAVESPPDGTVLSTSPDLRFLKQIAAPGDFIYNPSGPAHRFNK